MLEYRPWSRDVLDHAIGRYSNGELSILDMQLGGGCNYSCIYCDTPDRELITQSRIPIVELLCEGRKLDWLFICGLGEPLHPKNRKEFENLVVYCVKNDIEISMFTNLSVLDDEIGEYLQSGLLNVLFKLDSLIPEKVSKLYGTKSPDIQLNNVHRIGKYVHTRNHTTNLAASIVLTSHNDDEIESLCTFCDENQVFPMIADLEDSGRAQFQFSKLKLSSDKLRSIRTFLEARYGQTYSVPICPSVIAGIHVGTKGEVLVDEGTGLSCHWFWLIEPRIHTLGIVSKSYGYTTIRDAILSYRDDKISDVQTMLAENNGVPIGGCGGNIQQMLSLYLTAHKSMRDRWK